PNPEPEPSRSVPAPCRRRFYPPPSSPPRQRFSSAASGSPVLPFLTKARVPIKTHRNTLAGNFPLNGVNLIGLPYIFGISLGCIRRWAGAGKDEAVTIRTTKRVRNRAYGAYHQGGFRACCAWVFGADGICLSCRPAALAGGDTQTRGAGCELSPGSG